MTCFDHTRFILLPFDQGSVSIYCYFGYLLVYTSLQGLISMDAVYRQEAGGDYVTPQGGVQELMCADVHR